MMRDLLRWPVAAMLLALIVVAIALPDSSLAQTRTYTSSSDFDEGVLVNLNHDAPNSDQLQLDSGTSFNFIWVAVTERGTVVKIDTDTGEILGEYRSVPSNQWDERGNPSRTAVDHDGSVWVANGFDMWDWRGSVVHIGLEENGQCEDRNGNGIIDTSIGLGDILPWTDHSSPPRGVGTADDECIVHFKITNARGTRHVSVDANNDVWVGGHDTKVWDKIKGGRYDVQDSGKIIRTEDKWSQATTRMYSGGGGGLIDPNGVIWSIEPMLRWDTNNPLEGPNGIPPSPDLGPPILGRNWAGERNSSIYGLCIDGFGNVWGTHLNGTTGTGTIDRFDLSGVHQGTVEHGNMYGYGCATDANGDIWVAHGESGSGGNTVGHIRRNTDGSYEWVGNVNLLSNVNFMDGRNPNAVAVDAEGKIWSTNYRSNSVSRIDPSLNNGVGGVDMTVSLMGTDPNDVAGPINYSDMTGSIQGPPPSTGTWTVIYDSGLFGADWGTVEWNAAVFGDGSLTVKVASSDNMTFGPEETATNGGMLSVAPGQFLRITALFQRASNGDSPVLYDLTPSTDFDRDGVANNVDQCPYTPVGEAADATGCSQSQLDDDNDTVVNSLDQCPNTPPNESVEPNGCSQSQLDDDGDGVFNSVDQCPNTGIGDSVDTNGCAPYQVDTDSDGVMDDADQCPNTGIGDAVDTNGCAPYQVDTDSDGVMDDADLCPNTPAGEPVNGDGCPLTQQDEDGDGVLDDDDLCQGTMMPEEFVPTSKLSASRWVLGPNGMFVTKAKSNKSGKSGKKGKSSKKNAPPVFLVEDTGGCSCEQILNEISGSGGKSDKSGKSKKSDKSNKSDKSTKTKKSGKSDKSQKKLTEEHRNGCKAETIARWIAANRPVARMAGAARLTASVETLEKIHFAGETLGVPKTYELAGNYPNPFNPETTIRFGVPATADVRLAVYDMLGREVKVLVHGTVSAGMHEAAFDASSLPSGSYVYQLKTPEGRISKMMLLLK